MPAGLAKYLRQPVVLGEILAGVLLGPTFLGWLSPASFNWMFPADGPSAAALNVLTTLGISLFLFVAGMEVDLSTVWRQGRSALIVAVVGMAVPFALGFGAGFAAPRWLGMDHSGSRVIFALFIATAMSITALPVIAKILMDLQLFRSDIGMVIVAAAIVNDVAGWLISLSSGCLPTAASCTSSTSSHPRAICPICKPPTYTTPLTSS